MTFRAQHTGVERESVSIDPLASVIFEDGFESGDLTAWDQSQP